MRQHCIKTNKSHILFIESENLFLEIPNPNITMTKYSNNPNIRLPDKHNNRNLLNFLLYKNPDLVKSN